MYFVLESVTTATELLRTSSEVAYLNFINSIRTEASKRNYLYWL